MLLVFATPEWVQTTLKSFVAYGSEFWLRLWLAHQDMSAQACEDCRQGLAAPCGDREVLVPQDQAAAVGAHLAAFHLRWVDADERSAHFRVPLGHGPDRRHHTPLPQTHVCLRSLGQLGI